MRQTMDGRGKSYWDLFPHLEGQVNLSYTKPGQRRGFHLHQHKTDFWVLLQGRLKVVLAHVDHDLGGSELVFHEQSLESGESLTILPNYWHALQNIGEEDAILAYYETMKSGSLRQDDHELDLELYKGWE